jgi:hypothetical protein
MLPDGAVGEQLVSFSKDFAERREIKGIDDFEAGAELPRPKECNDTEDTQPIR